MKTAAAVVNVSIARQLGCGHTCPNRLHSAGAELVGMKKSTLASIDRAPRRHRAISRNRGVGSEQISPDAGMPKTRAINHVLGARCRGRYLGTQPPIAVSVGLVLMQMRWLYALNKIELALLIVSAGMMAAGVLLLLEIVFVLPPVSWQ
jgi:hypothetical protein